MKLKQIDEYNKLIRDIANLAEPLGYDVLIHPDATLTVTRKKPKVEDREKTPVKVEWSTIRAITPRGYDDYYYIVQFRVTGDWTKRRVRTSGHGGYEFEVIPNLRTSMLRQWEGAPCEVFIGLDARNKWSTPILLPESIFSRLDEITKALESKANEVKG